MFSQVKNSIAAGLRHLQSDVSAVSYPQLPMALPTGAQVDHSLMCDFQYPTSPNSQFMYEGDSLFDRCVSSASLQTLEPGLEQLCNAGSFPQYGDSDVISPSVEGLTFDTCDVVDYLFDVGLSAQSADISSVLNSMEPLEQQPCKHVDDKMLCVVDPGPTLNQLNTSDVETVLFDELDALKNLSCDLFMESVQQTADQKPNCVPCTETSVPQSSVDLTPSNWPQQSNVAIVSRPASTTIATAGINCLYPIVMDTHPIAGAECTVNSGKVLPANNVNSLVAVSGIKRSHSPEPDIKSVKFLNVNADWNWEEIESFLRSECQQMQATTSKKFKPDLTEIAEPTTDEKVIKPISEVSNSCSAGDEVDDEESIAEESDMSDNDFDINDLADSDNDDGDNLSFLLDTVSSNRKEKTYFWQYNTQAKGPKGKRLCKVVQEENPYILHDFEDPVFDSDLQACSSSRYRHSGKARRGDGNDITPNPFKLFLTGKELRKLSRLISEMTPSVEMSAAVRARTLREKNKYASRVCRLKKKAQHEANKIKLHGLDQEHRQLTKVLVAVRREMAGHIRNRHQNSEKLSVKMDMLMKTNLTVMTAGHTTEYVNSVLAKVAAGDKTGGLVYED